MVQTLTRPADIKAFSRYDRMHMALTRAAHAITGLSLLATFLAVAPAAAAAGSEGAVPGASRQPVGHRSQQAGFELGQLRIPTIGLDEIVRSGVAMTVIDQGVAQWAGTSPAGGSGNVVLAGHRTIHTAPFGDLHLLRPGDVIFLTTGDDFEVMYRVSETFIVAPDALWITYETGDPIVTLFACHPKGSAKERIVVRGDLIASGRIA